MLLNKLIGSDAGIQLTFNNVRNLGLTAAVFISSAYCGQHSAHSEERAYELAIAVILFAVGLFLGSINIAHGMEKLKAALPFGGFGKGATILLYALVAIQFLHVAVAARMGQ